MKANEEMINKIEKEIANGKAVNEACKEAGIHPTTFYSFKKKRKKPVGRGLTRNEVRHETILHSAPPKTGAPILLAIGDSEAIKSVLSAIKGMG